MSSNCVLFEFECNSNSNYNQSYFQNWFGKLTINMGLACVTEVHLNPFNSRPMSNLNPGLFPLSRSRPNSARLLFPRACVADEWGRGAPCSSSPLGQGRTRLHCAGTRLAASPRPAGTPAEGWPARRGGHALSSHRETTTLPLANPTRQAFPRLPTAPSPPRNRRGKALAHAATGLLDPLPTQNPSGLLQFGFLTIWAFLSSQPLFRRRGKWEGKRGEEKGEEGEERRVVVMPSP
jgi:hypothetical protein